MPLTRSFKELVQKRVGEDPEFGAALLRKGFDIQIESSTVENRASVNYRIEK